MSSDNVQALTPGTRLGDYRLDAVIGHGGFGITYRAFDTQLAKFVAIKEYLPVEFAVRGGDGKVVPRGARFAEDFAWGRERFLDEARALARFRHPHIVPVLRYFEANGTAYTVMEFEDGKSVGRASARAGRSPADRRRAAAGRRAVRAAWAPCTPRAFFIATSSRRTSSSAATAFPSDRLRRGAPGDGRALAHAHRRAHAAICADRAVRPRRQAGPVERHLLRRRRAPSRHRRTAAARRRRARRHRSLPAARRPAGRPLRAGVPWRDRSRLAFAPTDRPQTVEEWAALFGRSLARVADAPTQRLGSAPATPRLGGARREVDRRRLRHRHRRAGRGGDAMEAIGRLLLIVMAGAALGRLSGPIRSHCLPARRVRRGRAAATPPAPRRRRTRSAGPAHGAAAVTPPAPAPAPARTHAKQALIDQAARAAAAAHAVLERADEAARAARAMAGEARIVAARAARPDLENAERLSYDDGASYVGQVADGKRQGLGVVELSNGERQAGDWQDDRLNGLGTVRLADDTRYAGQWRDGQSTRARRAREAGRRSRRGQLRRRPARRPGRAPHARRARHRPIRRVPCRPARGPGRRTVGNQRYEGSFRAGKRNGYGQVTVPTARSSRAGGKMESQ